MLTSLNCKPNSFQIDGKLCEIINQMIFKGPGHSNRLKKVEVNGIDKYGWCHTICLKSLNAMSNITSFCHARQLARQSMDTTDHIDPYIIHTEFKSNLFYFCFIG